MDDLIVEMVRQTVDNLNSPKIREMIDYYTPYNSNIINDFKTVAIRLPRQSGHTTAACKLMKLYPYSVLIVPKHHMISLFRTLLEPEMFQNQIIAGDAYSLGIHADRFRGRNIDLVIFDPAHLFPGNAKNPWPLDDIKYELYAKWRPKLFVELE